MRVILIRPVEGLGSQGTQVEVSDGYARNYLLPRGLAVQATDSALKEWKARKVAEEKKTLRLREQAVEQSKRLSGAEIVIEAKAGEGGRLFGSVTAKDIAHAVRQQVGVDIDRRKIDLEDNLKTLGSYTVQVKLHPEVNAALRVSIVPAGGGEVR